MENFIAAAVIMAMVLLGVVAAFVRHTQIMKGNAPKPGDANYNDFFGGSRYGSRGIWR